MTTTDDEVRTDRVDLCSQYERHLGHVNPVLARRLQDSPTYFERLMDMVQVPVRRGALSALDQALIGLAVVGNVTYHHSDRVHAYIDRARAEGATDQHIHDTLQLASVLGVHSLTVGIPTIVEALVESGAMAPLDGDLDERRQQLKSDFISARGYWHESWDDMLAVDPDMFDAYLNYSKLPAEQGVLPPKLRELIYIAIDAVATHLYVPGIKLHAMNAIAAGATADELITAVEIASFIGANPYFDHLAET